jgi:hypothetical protein
MNQDLKSHINFMQGIKGPHWSARDEEWLKTTQEGFDWFLDDPLHKAKTLVVDNSYNRQEVLISLQQTKKWRILRRSPVIAGLAFTIIAQKCMRPASKLPILGVLSFYPDTCTMPSKRKNALRALSWI